MLTVYTNTPSRDVLPRATAEAQRAIALDSMSAEAYLAMGVARAYAFLWLPADSAFRRSVALDTALALNRLWYGRYLWATGRIDESLEQLRRATALDPLNATNPASLSLLLSAASRHDEAVATARRAFELDSTLYVAQSAYVFTLVNAGRPRDARAMGERLVRSGLRSPPTLGSAAYGIGRGGDAAHARSIAASLEPRSTEWLIQTALIRAYAGAGDTARTLAAMERAVAIGEPFPLNVPLIDNLYDPVRASPRFAAVVRALGLDVAKFTSPNGGRPQ